MSKQIFDLRVLFLGVGALMLAGCVEEPYRPAPPPGPPPAAIARVVVYPARGQSPQQQDRDRYECHVWAVQQTGFDPSQPGVPEGARVVVQPANPPGTGTAVGAIAGAILGAAIAGPRNAGAGLVLGGVTGAAIGASSDASNQAQANAQQRYYDRSYAQAQAGAANYRRAISACLMGRGYTIG